MAKIVRELYFGDVAEGENYPFKIYISELRQVVITNDETDARNVFINIPLDEWDTILSFIAKELQNG